MNYTSKNITAPRISTPAIALASKKLFLSARIICITLVFTFIIGVNGWAQRNITINAVSTTGGLWSFSFGTYTFTPNADNATIINTDIQDRLLGTGTVGTPGNVTVTTAGGGGAQPGNVTFSAAVTALTTSGTALTFT